MKIIFYDGECPLCNRAIRFLVTADQNQIFYFAPLQGKTAQEKLQHFHLQKPTLDTLVLYQDPEHIFIEGRAIFRIFWLLGGKYALLGWLSFLPSFLFDCAYRMVARFRYRLFSKKTFTAKTDHFLP